MQEYSLPNNLCNADFMQSGLILNTITSQLNPGWSQVDMDWPKAMSVPEEKVQQVTMAMSSAAFFCTVHIWWPLLSA